MPLPFAGRIAADVRESEPDWKPYLEPTAPEGAPNVLFVVWDDIGYGAWDLYGGLIEMPTMRRIAERGVRLSQFHTTALCSPTRAALLTGRNAQSNGTSSRRERSTRNPAAPRRSKTRCEKKPESAKKSSMRNAWSNPAMGASASLGDPSATK